MEDPLLFTPSKRNHSELLSLNIKTHQYSGSTSNGRTRGIFWGTKVEIPPVHQRMLTGIVMDSFGCQDLKFGTSWNWQDLLAFVYLEIKIDNLLF